MGPLDVGVADVGKQPVYGQHLDLKLWAGTFRKRVRRLRVAGCAPASRTPKGANPEKMFDAGGLPRLCPPHTGPARVEPRPGERGAAPEKGLGKLSICRPYVPSAYRFYAPEPEEMSRPKFNAFCGLPYVFTTGSNGIAPGSSGTFSLRFDFVWKFSYFASVRSATAQRPQAFDRTTPARMQTCRQRSGSPAMVPRVCSRRRAWPPAPALLHKSAEGRSFPFPGQTYPASSVTGMPSAVKPFRTATRTWNSAT